VVGFLSSVSAGDRPHHTEAFRQGLNETGYAEGRNVVIERLEALIGNVLDRCITDAGYRGHNAPPDHKFKVYTTSQKRRLTPQIKREFKRRAAIEPVIGHLKEHHRMGRNHLAHASGAPSTPCSPPPATTSDDSSRG
jgi:hypothetical protein